MRIQWIILLGALLWAGGGCCRYGFKGSTLPPGVKTVSLPLFTNKTLEVGLEDDLRSSVQAAIITDNTLKLTEGESDAELKVEITSYSNRPRDYDQSGRVLTYEVAIGIHLVFRNVREDQVLYEGNLVGLGKYDHQVETEDAGRELAMKKLNEMILSNTLSGW